MVCRPFTHTEEHNEEKYPSLSTADVQGAVGCHPPASASPPPQVSPPTSISQCMQKQPSCLARTGHPSTGTEKRCCCRDSNHSLRAQSMPHPLFPPQTPDIHLPTGNSQYLHEGLDAHGLVIPHQLGERGVSPVLPQDDVACIGLHLDHVVSAAAFTPGERDRQKQSQHAASARHNLVPAPCTRGLQRPVAIRILSNKYQAEAGDVLCTDMCS